MMQDVLRFNGNCQILFGYGTDKFCLWVVMVHKLNFKFQNVKSPIVHLIEKLISVIKAQFQSLRMG
jgi:hypothetical protein